MPTSALKEWFVLYTRPKYEKKIERETFRFDCESYLPCRTVFRKWSDRIKKIEEPLFPNYIFVRMDLKDRYKILGIDGVVRLISFGGKPVSVKDTEIDKIKKIETIAEDMHNERFCSIGEKVRVITGLFCGYEGELLKRLNKTRLLIKLPVIKQAVSIDISLHDVEMLA